MSSAEIFTQHVVLLPYLEPSGQPYQPATIVIGALRFNIQGYLL